jgi:hypothetical protein
MDAGGPKSVRHAQPELLIKMLGLIVFWGSVGWAPRSSDVHF